MNEKQYVGDVWRLRGTILEAMQAALAEPNPTGLDQRLALLDTIEEAICVLRESWENEDDEET